MIWGVLGFGSLAISIIAGAFIRALSAEKARGEADKRAAVLDANNTILQRDKADLADQLKLATERGDRLDDAFAKMLDEVASGASVGAYQRLLKIIAATKAARGGGSAPAVPAPTAAVHGPGSELLDPNGDD